MIELKRKSAFKLPLVFAACFIVGDLLLWWSGSTQGPGLAIKIAITIVAAFMLWLFLIKETVRADEAAIYSWNGLWPRRVPWEGISSVTKEQNNVRSKIIGFFGFEDQPRFLLVDWRGKVLMKLDFSETPEAQQVLLLNFIEQKIKQRQ